MITSSSGRPGAVRVLIVDDSAVVRGLVARVLGTDSQIQVAGTAMHGESALSWMRRNPVDVVVLDVEMPVMDGLETLSRIQAEFPSVRVIMASSLTYEGAETTLRALSMGAAACIAKPKGRTLSESMDRLTRELVPLAKELGSRSSGRSEAVSTRGGGEPGAAEFRPTRRPQVLLLGASTGGPQALNTVLTGLPKAFHLPILIVQHMPPLFTPILAQHIARDTGRACREGTDGEPLEKDTVYVAPGDRHMLIARRRDRTVIRIIEDAPEHYCRPSVNPLFRSAADHYGPAVLAVMLTGMGEDGLEGTRSVVAAGGYVIAQDRPSSIVWGMPGAIAREGLAHEILPLAELPAAISRAVLQEEAMPR